MNESKERVTMLSDLRSVYIDAYESVTYGVGADHSHAEMAGIRAVEVAVRADQIEKDAQLLEDMPSRDRGMTEYEAASTIRAQLKGVSDE